MFLLSDGNNSGDGSDGFIKLQRSSTHHHVRTLTKNKLTIEQLLTVQEAARTAPGVSASQLSRNMLTHDSPSKTISPQHVKKIQSLVYKERKKVQRQMLQGAAVDDVLLIDIV